MRAVLAGIKHDTPPKVRDHELYENAQNEFNIQSGKDSSHPSSSKLLPFKKVLSADYADCTD